MLFLKNSNKFILLLLLSFLTFSASGDEVPEQTELGSTETLILAQEDETLTNETSSKWDFIEHEENEPEFVENFIEESSEGSIQVSNYDAITIYIDASWGYRTDRAAEKITESHKEYAAIGYRLVDLDLYLEDSDLKGFFVTYERSSN